MLVKIGQTSQPHKCVESIEEIPKLKLDDMCINKDFQITFYLQEFQYGKQLSDRNKQNSYIRIYNYDTNVEKVTMIWAGSINICLAIVTQCGNKLQMGVQILLESLLFNYLRGQLKGGKKAGMQFIFFPVTLLASTFLIPLSILKYNKFTQILTI